MKHIDEVAGEKYANGSIGTIKKIQIEQHLKKCDKCRKIVDNVKIDRMLVEEIRDAVSVIDEVNTANSVLEKKTRHFLDEKFK